MNSHNVKCTEMYVFFLDINETDYWCFVVQENTI